jgi:hypothetical protein
MVTFGVLSLRVLARGMLRVLAFGVIGSMLRPSAAQCSERK